MPPELAAWGISVGTLTAFILLFQRFFKPVIDLGDQWQTVQAAFSGAERIFQVLVGKFMEVLQHAIHTALVNCIEAIG